RILIGIVSSIKRYSFFFLQEKESKRTLARNSVSLICFRCETNLNKDVPGETEFRRKVFLLLLFFVHKEKKGRSPRIRRSLPRTSSGTPPGPPRPPWAWRCKCWPAGRLRSCGPSGCRNRQPW